MKYLQVRCDQRPFFPPLEQIPLCIQLELQINPVFRPFFFFLAIQHSALFFVFFLFNRGVESNQKRQNTIGCSLALSHF